MQSIVDLLNYWTEIGGFRRRSKRITVRILAQDDERVIEEIAQYQGNSFALTQVIDLTLRMGFRVSICDGDCFFFFGCGDLYTWD
jgi:hypothetical protein